MATQLKIFDTPKQAAEACGKAIFDQLTAAREECGIGTVAVSGGSTPRIMFEWMAQQSFDWKGIQIFWVDERCVPPDDEQSNYRMTKLALLDAINLHSNQIHRIEGEIDPAEAAKKYEEEIRQCLGIDDADLPIFNVIQRGMGPDAHTASLFPGEPMVLNTDGVCAALWVEKMKQHRVTLLPKVLELAQLTVNLVTGKDKAAALHKVLEGERDPLHYPAQISSPEMIWFLDRDAAAEITVK